MFEYNFFFSTNYSKFFLVNILLSLVLLCWWNWNFFKKKLLKNESKIIFFNSTIFFDKSLHLGLKNCIKNFVQNWKIIPNFQLTIFLTKKKNGARIKKNFPFNKCIRKNPKVFSCITSLRRDKCTILSQSR